MARPPRTLEEGFEARLDAEARARPRRKGRAALPMLLGASTLAVLCMLVSAGVREAGNWRPKAAAAASARTDVAAVRQAVESLYAGQADRAGLDGRLLVSSGAVPAAMAPGGRLRHSLGGAVTVAAAEAGYAVTLHAVPGWACLSLVSGSDAPEGALATTVGVPGGKSASLGSSPLSAADGAALCAVPLGGDFDVTWAFR